MYPVSHSGDGVTRLDLTYGRLIMVLTSLDRITKVGIHAGLKY